MEDEQLAHIESAFREVNEAIAKTAERLDSDEVDVICECADPVCSERLTISLEDLHHEEGTVSASVRYEAGDATWSHAFTAYVLDDAELDASLAAVGLKLDAVLDDAGRWVAAVQG